jgi:hypothetical protein
MTAHDWLVFALIHLYALSWMSLGLILTVRRDSHV